MIKTYMFLHGKIHKTKKTSKGYIRKLFTYDCGLLHGSYKMWHPNKVSYRIPNLHIHSKYKNGRIDGFYKEWNKEGDLVKHDIYANGFHIESIL